ncbi:hypothetical protein BJV78DRAFT_374713 [Lactifluus subvellereus]|nr:hypothetical protein BJV78DRAFT_374713 [Lactifluus subvellereus]
MQGKVDTCGLWGTFEGGLRLAAEGGLRGREATSAAVLRSRSLSLDGATALPSSPSSSEQDSIKTALSIPDAATPETSLHVLFFGFSLGNFPRGEEVAFLKALPLRAGKGDTLLVGIDHCTNGARIERAYTDQAGIERRFILNSLKCAGGALGDESLFVREKWEYEGCYNAEERASLLRESVSVMVANGSGLDDSSVGLDRHESFCRSRVAQTVCDPQTKAEFTFLEDELVMIQVAHTVGISQCNPIQF